MSCLSLTMRHSAILILVSILLSFELFHDVFVFEMMCKIGKVSRWFQTRRDTTHPPVSSDLVCCFTFTLCQRVGLYSSR